MYLLRWNKILQIKVLDFMEFIKSISEYNSCYLLIQACDFLIFGIFVFLYANFEKNSLILVWYGPVHRPSVNLLVPSITQ